MSSFIEINGSPHQIQACEWRLAGRWRRGAGAPPPRPASPPRGAHALPTRSPHKISRIGSKGRRTPGSHIHKKAQGRPCRARLRRPGRDSCWVIVHTASMMREEPCHPSSSGFPIQQMGQGSTSAKHLESKRQPLSHGRVGARGRRGLHAAGASCTDSRRKSKGGTRSGGDDGLQHQTPQGMQAKQPAMHVHPGKCNLLTTATRLHCFHSEI